MISKVAEKEKAIAMRREGKTYSEIRQVVPVAKSTISLWFKEVGLSVPQQQILTANRLAAAKRGGRAKRQQRIDRTASLVHAARADIGSITDRELFLVGAVLYWAEGHKEKAFRPSCQMMFSNMDPQMIAVFLRWLDGCLGVPRDMVTFEIYLHETHRHRLESIKEYWSQVTGFPVEEFKKTYFKKTIVKTIHRKNITEATYFGVLRIRVKQSSRYVRKLAGWAQGIYDAVA